MPSDGKKPPKLRLIMRDELLTIVPYTIQHIYRLEKIGAFPRRVQIGPMRVAWVYAEVEEWIEARMAARTEAAPTITDSDKPNLKPLSELRVQVDDQASCASEEIGLSSPACSSPFPPLPRRLPRRTTSR